MKFITHLIIFLFPLLISAQYPESGIKIRTITAGVNLDDINDTESIHKAIEFLNNAREKYSVEGYEVQTIRIATQNFHLYSDATIAANIIFLKKIDEIAKKHNVEVSIGQILPPNTYSQEASLLAIKIINNTERINFSIPISSKELGVMPKSIQSAAETIMAIAQNSERGMGNFRFTASANVPPGTPFFPAAYHEGENNFSIGLESPNAIKKSFSKGWFDENSKETLKKDLDSLLKPIENIAIDIDETFDGYKYHGIDTSPAPGLDASIGDAIEELSRTPFGEPATLRACAMITDVLKSIDVKRCGYSGLMLPVMEDRTLAKRAMEGRYDVHELLLYSAVSGTGLDVVPLPGNISMDKISGLLQDIAALSLKYEDKALSARLFIVPGKDKGYYFYSDNPYLTGCTIMNLD